ncbi:MAG: ribosome recycling factor [Chloroflexi bacterium HGW-Chloroflexi-1]|nr:MAG: ribosome recycling factor [Chloroflexi bacterium HGW-Chloroflexi-1]
MLKDVMSEAKDRMEKTVEALYNDLRTIRTGRASPALVERLQVDYYGSPTPLNQLAGISVPEPRVLAIRPWDRNTIGIIEKAILKSDLGLTPGNDGQIIRLIIPQLTEERRRDLNRQVAKRVEEGRVAIRNIRRDAIDMLRDFEKEKVISEDDFYTGRDQVQELTDAFIKQIDEVGKTKEAEILEV